MNIMCGHGAFYAATMDEIRTFVRENIGDIEALLDRLMGFGTIEDAAFYDAVPVGCAGYVKTPREIEREGWRKAAFLSRTRAAARAQAYARMMQGEKARRAMKRRKLMHADGSFPDWECRGAG